MATRPFYLSADIEGRKTPLEGGTRFKEGQSTITLTQRNKGSIETAFVIKTHSRYNEDGVLTLYTDILNEDGVLIARKETLY